jgi:hypothetical protein
MLRVETDYKKTFQKCFGYNRDLISFQEYSCDCFLK